MNQTASNSEPHNSSFLFGLTVGVLGSLLLGTEEGRQLMREIIKTLPEPLRNLGQDSAAENIPDFAPPLNTPEETPHHSYYAQTESPPPPPPHTSPRPDYLYPAK